MKEDNLPLGMWELLPEAIRNSLARALDAYSEKDETEKRAISRSCPHCGSQETIDCSEIDGLADVTVGLCATCGYLWCMECDCALLTSVNCGHWQICAGCGEEKEPCGYCGVLPWDCIHIKEWLARAHPRV